MAMWLATSRLSPFSSSLLSSASPAQLPALPTLAELQKRAEDLRSGLVDTVQPYLGNAEPPAVAGTRRPPAAIAISRSVRQPVRPTGVAVAPPPPYRSLEEPMMVGQVVYAGKRAGGEGGRGARLKKGKAGWRRIQEGIPGEKVTLRAHKMSGKEERVTWREWLTCRGGA